MRLVVQVSGREPGGTAVPREQPMEFRLIIFDTTLRDGALRIGRA